MYWETLKVLQRWHFNCSELSVKLWFRFYIGLARSDVIDSETILYRTRPVFDATKPGCHSNRTQSTVRSVHFGKLDPIKPFRQCCEQIYGYVDHIKIGSFIFVNWNCWNKSSGLRISAIKSFLDRLVVDQMDVSPFNRQIQRDCHQHSLSQTSM